MILSSLLEDRDKPVYWSEIRMISAVSWYSVDDGVNGWYFWTSEAEFFQESEVLIISSGIRSLCKKTENNVALCLWSILLTLSAHLEVNSSPWTIDRPWAAFQSLSVTGNCAVSVFLVVHSQQSIIFHSCNTLMNNHIGTTVSHLLVERWDTETY